VIAVGAPAIGTFAMVSPLAITGDGIRQASRSVVRKGDSIPTSQRSKEQGERFDTHARHNARPARSLGLFAVQTVERPTHCEWRPSPYDNNIDSPGVVRQQGRQSIMHTTVKWGTCSLFLRQRNPNKPMVQCNSTRMT
jgi:hypothetical protein